MNKLQHTCTIKYVYIPLLIKYNAIRLNININIDTTFSGTERKIIMQFFKYQLQVLNLYIKFKVNNDIKIENFKSKKRHY